MTTEVLHDNIFLDLLHIYPTACRRKWHSSETQSFDLDRFDELDTLAWCLADHTYRPEPGYRFVVHDPVVREVFASHFADRVVHHLYFEYVSPIVERQFINNSFSCRKGRGTLFGVKQLHRDLWSCSNQGRDQVYVLKGDLSGYFMHIDRSVLRDITHDLIARYHYTGKEARYSYRRDVALFLTDIFALRDPLVGSTRRGVLSEWDAVPARKKMESSPEGCGLPIGDLTSQLFSNIYLNVFDQWMKRTMHCTYYGRYVDDFYVVCRDRSFLTQLLPLTGTFLQTHLHLSLSPKKCHIYRVSDKGEGIHFLGARLFLHYILASHRTIRGFLRARSVETLNSYKGQLKHYASGGLM